MDEVRVLMRCMSAQPSVITRGQDFLRSSIWNPDGPATNGVGFRALGIEMDDVTAEEQGRDRGSNLPF